MKKFFLLQEKLKGFLKRKEFFENLLNNIEKDIKRLNYQNVVIDLSR